jgi:hypothetical protein
MPFKKGQSGNPGGRVKLPEAFRERCKSAVDRIVIDAWEDEVELKTRKRKINGVEVEMQSRGPEWIKASELLSSYGYGKPAQPITGENGEGAIQASIKVVFVGAKE